ncbi:FkbM family methyltransferase [Acidisphaera sp. L21]|uniref:FkbM family methyltransferase n=1 Tax=Acidisphaera sp. L21 TaxID=1641851 RepID=UPI00131D8B5F|nr:FkbM family methyltransferase [Acidisphaera sp. L21]
MMDIPQDDHDLVGRFLASSGEWAFDETSFVAACLPDAPRVMDGGAFLGTFGLGLGLIKPLGFLCAVEANATALALLQSNLRRNACMPMEIIGALLAGPNTQPQPGHADPANLGSASYGDSAAEGIALPHPAASMTLAALRERFGPFDLIKLDIEGMERDVLLGDAEYLARGTTSLWVECNEHSRSLDLGSLLLSWDLDLFYFAFPSHNPDNFRGSNDQLLPWAYEAGLLAAPKIKPRLSEQLTAHRCILRPIRSREELEEAMWFTPRWLPQELADANPTTLAAVASRALSGQARDVFMRANVQLDGLSIWERLERTQDGLAQAQALLTSLTGELETERHIRHEVEQLAISRLAEMNGERQLRTDAEAVAAASAGELAQERALRDEAEAVVKARASEFLHERNLRHEAETRAAAAMSAALLRLEELGLAREAAIKAAAADVERLGTHLATSKTRATTAEHQAETLHAALQDLANQLALMRASLGWRVVNRGQRFVSGKPRLHGLLRRMRAVVGTAIGRRK